ncbi:hypothetical protein ACQP2E_11445 [Actinoplanes sp. CA-015351]|uniref:hypothetical protein n=1 Tax=Actinoplanes sp. CA-015351 TaxID=3239897 RepID=UPI003D98D575
MPEFWEAVGQRWQAAVDAAGDVPDGRLVTEELRRRDRRELSGTIAITGYRGAGKTVLRDGLLNRIEQNYVPPPKSLVDELHRFTLERGRDLRRMGLVVVPGQSSADRSDSLARIFDPRREIAPAGVIHVVCWGHNTIDSVQDRRTIRKEIEASGREFDLGALQDWNRQAELEEFRQVAEHVGGVWGRNSTPWLIIAVAQSHLYWNAIERAAHHYVPGWPDPDEKKPGQPVPGQPVPGQPVPGQLGRGHSVPGREPEPESEFRQDLRGLVEDMRTRGQTRIAVLPLASYPNDYRFDNIRIKSGLGAAEGRNLMGTFATTLGEFCDLGTR